MLKLCSLKLAGLLAIAVFVWACGEGAISGEPGAPRQAGEPGSPSTTSEPDPETPPSPSQPPFVSGGECTSLEMESLPGCDGSAYFVDAASGSDSNPGSSAAPWRSLHHARDTAPSGATICVNSGSYGSFSDTTPPGLSAPHVIRAAPGHTPSLSGLRIVYGSLAEADLTMSGFDVRGAAGDVAVIENAIGVRLTNMRISAVKWAVNGVGVDGLRIFDSQDITIDHTKFESLNRGMQVQDSDNTRILNNDIGVAQGSGIQYLYRNTNGEIAYNHIHGVDFNASDPDAVANPHASIISFRSGDVVLRGNHLHGMGNSSGIMFYNEAQVPEYSNVLIENNAIYDVTNTYAIRVNNLGGNFVVRNNVVFPGQRDGECNGSSADARYRYNTAIIVHNLAPSGSGIHLYNNVLVGIVSVGDEAIIEERNNYAWAWKNWVTSSPSGTSEIVTSKHEGCGEHDRIFENGSFFNSSLNPAFPGRSTHDLRLTAGSPGENFGDPSVQSGEGIGTIDADGFVRMDGPCRDTDRHSVGAYEFE